MSRKKGWKFFWCSKIQFKHIFERNFNFWKIRKKSSLGHFVYWRIEFIFGHFWIKQEVKRGQSEVKWNPNSTVTIDVTITGINVTLSQNVSHVSVFLEGVTDAMIIITIMPSAQWFVTCLLLWATGQIEINRLNAKTVLKIMIDNLWILNFKKLLWSSVLTYILRVPYSRPARGHPILRPPLTVRRALLSEQKRKSFLTTVARLEPTASGIDRSVIFWLSGVAVESGSGRWRGKFTATRSAEI